MNRILILILASVAAFGQLTTPSTTLSSAVTSSSTAQWCLSSATGVVVPSLASGQNGSYLLADREVAQVTSTGTSSTCFKVKRGQLGTAASVGHSAAARVWIGQPATSSGDPSRPFTGAFVNTVPTGSCVASDQYTLPVLYVGSAAQGATPGSQWQCTQNQWVQAGDIQFMSVAAATVGNIVISDTVGTGNSGFIGRRANGTTAVPTAIQSGDIMAAFGGRGYMATGYSTISRGDMLVMATENWTDSANGTRVIFGTTANGAASRTSRWYIDQDGGFKPFTNGAVGLGSSTQQIATLSMANCTSSASPAVCAANSVGAVAVAAAATSLVVNTTAVTAKSRIVLTMDSSLGSDLSVTCNTTNIAAWVSARTAGTSFTITTASGPVTNPMCLSYHILN